jgi:hypothetical protein
MGNIRKLGTIGGGTIEKVQMVNILDRTKRIKRMTGMSTGRPVDYVLLNKEGCLDGTVMIKVHDDGSIEIQADDGVDFTMMDLFDLMPMEAQEEMIWKMDTLL